MPSAESAELLELYNEMSGRAPSDVIDDPTKFRRLTRAQRELFTDIMRVAPWTMYQKVGTPSIPQLYTTDHNVFTFSNDPDVPIIPFGDTQIYEKFTDIPDRPLRQGWDYENEQTQIRLPRNRKRTGPLYWRGAVFPPAIDADTPPSLLPVEMAIELIAMIATRNFAESGNIRNAPLADRKSARYQERFAKWALILKRQFHKGGALRVWTARDLVTPLL